MINLDDVTAKPKKEHNTNWPQIPDHLYKILIIAEPNASFNLMNHQPDIGIFIYTKDPY